MLHYTTEKRQLYLENTSSVLLVMTEETDLSSCPPSLAGKQQLTHLFVNYASVCREGFCKCHRCENGSAGFPAL